MPAPRRTKIHVEAVEELGSQLTLLVANVQEVCEDGRVEPGENELLHGIMARTVATYSRLPPQAMTIDNGARMISILADTMAITPWTARVAREFAADEQALGTVEEIRSLQAA